jgi:membrane protein required for colicin V production
MTLLDYFVLIIAAASLVAGAVKGIVKGIISVTFAVAGILAAASFYPDAANWFGWITSNRRAAELIGFITVFVLMLAIGSALTFLVRKSLKRAKLTWADHALGAAFGLLRGWLICSALYLALTAFPLNPDAVRRAVLGPVLLEGTRVIAYCTSRDMKTRFAQGYDAVRGLTGRSS